MITSDSTGYKSFKLVITDSYTHQDMTFDYVDFDFCKQAANSIRASYNGRYKFYCLDITANRLVDISKI